MPVVCFRLALQEWDWEGVKLCLTITGGEGHWDMALKNLRDLGKPLVLPDM